MNYLGKMSMKNIFRSVLLSVIGLSLLGWVSFSFTALNALGPDGDSNLLQWYFDKNPDSND